MRSLLFVPGDSPRKLAKGLESGADALILDLEDSVGPDAKAEARGVTARVLAEAGANPLLFVRVNALDTGLTDADLDAVLPGRPHGVVLPKAVSGADVPRLDGLAWGGEDLSADIGAETNRLPDGSYAEPYRLARTLTLVAAAAAEAQAIDTVFTNFRDPEGLRREAELAVRDGFTAKMAIHPAQVPVINEAFTPSPDAVRRAEAVVAAFAREPGAGVVGLDGRMLDRPHLRQAQRLLDRAKHAGVM